MRKSALRRTDKKTAAEQQPYRSMCVRRWLAQAADGGTDLPHDRHDMDAAPEMMAKNLEPGQPRMRLDHMPGGRHDTAITLPTPSHF